MSTRPIDDTIQIPPQTRVDMNIYRQTRRGDRARWFSIVYQKGLQTRIYWAAKVKPDAIKERDKTFERMVREGTAAWRSRKRVLPTGLAARMRVKYLALHKDKTPVYLPNGQPALFDSPVEVRAFLSCNTNHSPVKKPTP